MDDKNFETEAIRTQIERSQFLEHSSPLSSSSRGVTLSGVEVRKTTLKPCPTQPPNYDKQ